MDARTIKGMEIAATRALHRSERGWVVPSQTGNGSYVVVPHPTTTAKVARGERPSPDGVEPWECTCPDFEERRRACKHVLAVEFTIRRQRVDADGATVTETVKVTYTQDWTAYNRAQCEEKERFLPMLADLCSTIPQPPQGNGRPRLPMSDMAFAAISKVYSGLSARRFDTDVRDNAAKGLTAQDAHFNSVLRYLRSEDMTPILEALVTLSALPLRAVESDFAIDSTGFSTCRYVRWYDHKWGKEQVKREWVKLHAMVGVQNNVVTGVEMTGWRGADYNELPGLVKATGKHFDMREVSADKAYLGRNNLDAIAKTGATPFIPVKANTYVPGPTHSDNIPALPAASSAWDKMYRFFAYQRDTFLTHYHKRSNVETTFSMIKRKFGDSLRSKSDTGQFNEVLCKVVCHNLCCLISAIHELGLDSPTFAPLPAK